MRLVSAGSYSDSRTFPPGFMRKRDLSMSIIALDKTETAGMIVAGWGGGSNAAGHLRGRRNEHKLNVPELFLFCFVEAHDITVQRRRLLSARNDLRDSALPSGVF